MQYEFIKHLPVAKFYYKGTHSHPVRRTVVIIESSKDHICGYELREGSTIRKMKNAPIKSYKKEKIATKSQLGACKHKLPGPNVSTLERINVLDLLKTGV